MATRKTSTTAQSTTSTAPASAPSKATPRSRTTTAPTKSAAPDKASTPGKTAPRRKATARVAAATNLYLSPEQRHHWICTAAYFMAEHSGFQGSPVEFWLCAEAQVDQQLRV
ncbi:MAG: DUF2934 domain-containing protein [Pseudomonadota bacterium]